MFKLFNIVIVIMMFFGFLRDVEAVETNKENLDIQSESVVLIDAKTGVVLYTKDPFQQMYPASITKIMTVYLALENKEHDDVMIASETAIDSIDRQSSHIWLNYDEEITVEDACYATLLASANDASNVLAEHVAGTQEAFAELMTNTAYDAQAMNVNFSNAHGLPDENHYASAYDMAMITRFALQNDEFRKIFETVKYTMQPTNKQSDQRYFATGNELLKQGEYYYEYAVGGKTGWTEDSGYTLVATAKKDNLELIAVVMNSESVDQRYLDAVTLFEYGFENYIMHTIDSTDFTTQQMQVLNNDKVEADVTFTQKDSLMMILDATTELDSIYYNYVISEEDDADLMACVAQVYVGADLVAELDMKKDIVKYDLSFNTQVLPKIIFAIEIFCACVCVFFMGLALLAYTMKKTSK